MTRFFSPVQPFLHLLWVQAWMSSISHCFELTWQTTSVPSSRPLRPPSYDAQGSNRPVSIARSARCSLWRWRSSSCWLSCRTFSCRFKWRYEATPPIDTTTVSYRYEEEEGLDGRPRSPGRGSIGNGLPIDAAFLSDQRFGSKRGFVLRSMSRDRSPYGLFSVLLRSSKGG